MRLSALHNVRDVCGVKDEWLSVLYSISFYFSSEFMTYDIIYKEKLNLIA